MGPPVLATFKLTVAYDGTDYLGWQVQPQGPTIQSMLERAVTQITGETARVLGSGRTDSGVHADGQVAAVSLAGWKHDAESLRQALQTKLPEDIVVWRAESVRGDFHPIGDATEKLYRYQLQLSGPADPMTARYRWRLRRPVDADAVCSACTHVVGRHDFSCFEARGAPRADSVREVRRCELMIAPPTNRGRVLADLYVSADGFLYNMVRNIVGSVLEVGYGLKDPDWITELIRERRRENAGPTAPPHGLFLDRVSYE